MTPSLPKNRRLILLFGLLIVGASYMVASGMINPLTESPEPDTLNRDRLVQPEENGSYIWPYTSRDQSIDERTLAINLIIHGSDNRVQQTLTAQDELKWEELDPEVEEEPETSEDAEDPIQWDDAHGSIRYTYVDTGPHGDEPRWIEESYQLHSGAYLGSRDHIRAYTTEHDNWTAIQVHQEYFDWFRLRHTVTDIQGSRNTLEGEYLDEPYVEEVRRVYYGTHYGWNDGWLSVIELATIGPLVVSGVVGLLGLIGGETTQEIVRGGRQLITWVYQNIRGFILAGALAGLIVGVRTAGLVVEAAVAWITPQAFVVVLYPILAVGVPVTTVVLTQPLEAATRFLRLQWLASWIGHPLEPLPAFAFTVAGFGAGIIVNLLAIGITTLPMELLLHRLGLMITLGLLAAGAARTDTEGATLFGIGLVGWIVGLVMPLFGYI